MAKVLHGSESGDQLNVSENKTQAYGLSGNDTLISDNMSDVLLIGGSGDDKFIMTGGIGTLNGGGGADTFEFTYSADKKVDAVIEDFDPSNDKIIVNFDGNTTPQLTSVASGKDVVRKDADGLFNLTLKSVRENDYFDGTASDEIWKVLELTNAEREKESLPALTLAEGLMLGASIRAEEITAKGKLGVLTDHTRLDNKTAYYTVLEGKYNYPGENLDGGASSPEQVVEDWMKSKSHKENILRENFQRIGVGYNYDDPDPTNHRYYWTQMFADSLKSSETIPTTLLSSVKVGVDTVSNFISLTDENDALSNSDYGTTLDARAGDDSINNAGLIVSISGGAGNDTVENSGSFATINAGTGNDRISLASDTKEILIEYAAGDGSDTISGFNETDTLSISKDISFTPELLGNDIILTIEDDSIKLLDAASLANDLSFIDGYWIGVIVINDDNYNHNFSNGIEGLAGATIKALGGNNTIANGYYGDYVSIECADGNDSILNNGDLVTINSNGGNDSIQNIAGDGVSINTADGNDSVLNGAAVQVTINTGAGDDNIENSYRSNRVSINSGVGNDSIQNRAVDAAIDADIGNDRITNWEEGTGSSIQGYKGSDSINNYASNVTIDGGDGNDEIHNSGDSVTIDGGSDNDYIRNEGSNVSISGGIDNDTIISSGSNVTIGVGRGNDRIELSEDAQNNLIKYTKGDGSDEVWGFNATDKIIIGDGTGTYFPETLNGHLFINVGNGYIALGNGASLSAVDIVEGVVGEPIEDPATIYLPEDTEAFENTLDNITLKAQDDDYLNHSITNSGEGVAIIPGESYNTINNSGDNVYISGKTESSNTITNTGDNVQIEGINAHNSVTNTGNNVKIGNLEVFGPSTVDNSGNNALIMGGQVKDSIVNSGNNAYILGWYGDDIIELSGDAQNNVIAYQQGDGFDTVRGFNETDTLLVYVVSPYSIQTVDNDVIIDVNNGIGSLTLEDAATLASKNIRITKLNGNSVTMHINGNSVTFEGAGIVEGNSVILGEGDDSYDNSSADMVIQALDGNDTVINYGDNVTTDLGAGNDYLINQADNVSISGGADDDTIASSPYNSDLTIDGGSGNDEIQNFSANASINSGKGNDTIVNYGASATISSGAGNDSIESYGNTSRINLGAGDDELSNYGDSVTIAGGKGNDYIVNYGDAATTSIITGDGEDSITNYATNVTIAAGAGNDSVFSNGASSIINLGTGNDFLHNRGNNTSINLGDDDDTVITDASNVTIRGGAGNDRISLEGDAKDVVINYTAGDGNDTIWGLTKDNAKLRIKGVKYYSTVPSGDDVIVKVGENTITLKNFRDKPSDIIIGASGSSGGTGGNNGGSTGGNGGSTGGTSGSNSNSAASGGNSAGGSSGSNSSSNGSSGNGNRNYSVSRTTSVRQNVVTVPSGNQFFANYQSGQKLYLGSEYTGAFFDNAGDFVAGSATGAICVRNALDKVIDFTDGAGNLIKAYAARNAGIIDGRNIAGREIINGSNGSDTIYAGDGGSDTFLSGKGHGADLIRNASSADVVYLKDAALSDITATSESNGMISVSFNTGNVINVQSTESVSARFNLTDGSAYRYNHTTKAWETLQQAPPAANQSTYTGDNQFISAGRFGNKIVLDTNFTDMNYDGGSNFVVNAPTGSLVVRNALDKVIDLSNVKGTPITKAYAASTPGLIDGRGLAGREIINGSAGADVICAGDGGSQLWGGADNAADVLIGGDGADVFIGGKNQGADLILNASVEDVVNFNDATISDITSATESGGKISISFNTGNTVNVQSSLFLSAKFVLADGSSYRYSHATKSWRTG